MAVRGPESPRPRRQPSPSHPLVRVSPRMAPYTPWRLFVGWCLSHSERRTSWASSAIAWTTSSASGGTAQTPARCSTQPGRGRPSHPLPEDGPHAARDPQPSGGDRPLQGHRQPQTPGPGYSEPAPAAPRERRPPRQTLTGAERDGVLALLHEERFVDLPPAQILAQVLGADDRYSPRYDHAADGERRRALPGAGVGLRTSGTRRITRGCCPG